MTSDTTAILVLRCAGSVVIIAGWLEGMRRLSAWGRNKAREHSARVRVAKVALTVLASAGFWMTALPFELSAVVPVTWTRATAARIVRGPREIAWGPIPRLSIPRGYAITERTDEKLELARPETGTLLPSLCALSHLSAEQTEADWDAVASHFESGNMRLDSPGGVFSGYRTPKSVGPVRRGWLTVSLFNREMGILVLYDGPEETWSEFEDSLRRVEPERQTD